MSIKFKESILGIPAGKSLVEIMKRNGMFSNLTTLIAVSLALFHITSSYMGQLEAFRHRATHLLLVVFLAFLSSIEERVQKGDDNLGRRNLFISIDAFFALGALVCLVYTFVNSPLLPLRAGDPTTWDFFIGVFTLFLTIEVARRHVGLGIVVVCVFFLFYVYAGPWFPGFLRHAPFSVSEIITIQYLDLEGLWGAPLGAAASFVIVFLLFAGLLIESGILNVFMDFAMKLLGRSIGGPAKVAVVSSGLIGMVNGTAVGNTLLTGQISIPLMKKMGYKSPFAAAVEATASTGGQVMPPIMGSAAFIIAMTLGIHYKEVCKAALIPALLWFFSIFVIVHLEAVKLGLKALSEEDITGLPSWTKLWKQSYLAFPMILLIVFMLLGYSEIRAGFWGIITLIFLSFANRESHFTVKNLIAGLKVGVKMAFSVTSACACAGIIVGCVMQSGLGYTLSASLIKVSGGNAFILLPMVMMAAIILGTGMMTVGVYIIVSVLVIPAMVTMGFDTMACHLFAFYFGILCNVTPPVATAAYGAAGIAGTSPWSTGMTAFKLAAPIFCIPYIFITQPALLLHGAMPDILITILAAIGAVFSFDIAVAGYLFRKCAIFERGLFFLSGICFAWKGKLVPLIGLALFMFCIVLLKYSVKTTTSNTSVECKGVHNIDN